MSVPEANDVSEVGFSRSSDDPHLTENTKLPILTSVDDADIPVETAVAWAYRKWYSKPESILQMYCAGAAVTVGCGLCRRRMVDDGAWMIDGHCIELPDASAIKPLEGQLAQKVTEWIIPENLDDARDIIIATKESWWACNHHTGGNHIRAYLKQVLMKRFGEITRDHIEMASVIGRWASTAYILTWAGVQRIQANRFGEPFHNNTQWLMLSKEEMSRFECVPAGNSRLTLAHESAQILFKSPLVKYCPDYLDFHTIYTLLKEVVANPAVHHQSCSYLTDETAEFGDQYFESFLGRLGTYIRIMCPDSTLAASPHFTENEVRSYPDYSAEWESFLWNYKESGRISSGRMYYGSGRGASTENKALFGRASRTTNQAVVDRGTSTENRSLFGRGSSTENKALYGRGSSTTNQAVVDRGASTENKALYGRGSSTVNKALYGRGSSTVNQAVVGRGASIENRSLFGRGSSTENKALFGRGSSTVHQAVVVRGASTENRSLFGRDSSFVNQIPVGRGTRTDFASYLNLKFAEYDKKLGNQNK